MTLDDVWHAAAPYLRVRKNDIHVPISFDYAERLLEEHHRQIGWSCASRYCSTTSAGIRSTKGTSSPKAPARTGSNPTSATFMSAKDVGWLRSPEEKQAISYIIRKMR